MKFMLKLTFANPSANEKIKDPKFGENMGKILEEIKAEAAYFGLIDGKRGGYIVINLNDATDMVKVAEPLFLYLNADIDLLPVMSPQELGKAAPYMNQAVKNWG